VIAPSDVTSFSRSMSNRSVGASGLRGTSVQRRLADRSRHTRCEQWRWSAEMHVRLAKARCSCMVSFKLEPMQPAEHNREVLVRQRWNAVQGHGAGQNICTFVGKSSRKKTH
jgi:hypothetical protein